MCVSLTVNHASAGSPLLARKKKKNLSLAAEFTTQGRAGYELKLIGGEQLMPILS